MRWIKLCQFYELESTSLTTYGMKRDYWLWQCFLLPISITDLLSTTKVDQNPILCYCPVEIRATVCQIEMRLTILNRKLTKMKWILVLVVVVKWRLHVNKYGGERQLKYWTAKKKKILVTAWQLAGSLSPWFTIYLLMPEIHQLINYKRQQKLFHE